MTQKTCFVISRIGAEDSPERRESDCVLRYIIKPAMERVGYAEPVRVDEQDKPAHITTEIIQQLINADLVVADLSGLNPNVFYELGIRHAFQKPCILLSNWDPEPPFDLAHTNTIRFVHNDPNSHDKAIDRIISQIQMFENEEKVSNPVTIANGYSELSTKGDDRDQLLLRLSRDVLNLAAMTYSLEQKIAPKPVLGQSGGKGLMQLDPDQYWLRSEHKLNPKNVLRTEFLERNGLDDGDEEP